MAAKLLKLSVRQARRLKHKVKKQGISGLTHGNHGQASHNRLPKRELVKIVGWLHKHYYDFGPTFASEKLRDDHGLDHDPKTIRQIMIDQGLWKPRKKKTALPHRQWRERKSAYGEMIQFDGSYEHWLEDRGGTGEICLLAAIDDATGKIVSAEFSSHEGVLPVFAFWQRYLVAQGKPRLIYLDKFSTYHQNQSLAKENNDTLTQFQRAMAELRIEVIPANSPQAKGRVERLFGTLQDRLIKELRLANVSNSNQANEFLKKEFILKFNAKFAVTPRSEADLHQPLGIKEQKQLAGILSRQTERTVLNDFTFSFQNQWYQLIKEQPVTVCKKDTVIVEEHLDHSIYIRLRGKHLNYQLLPKRPEKQIAPIQIPWVLPASKAYIPPANHPWRQTFYATAQTNLQRTAIPR